MTMWILLTQVLVYDYKAFCLVSGFQRWSLNDDFFKSLVQRQFSLSLG